MDGVPRCKRVLLGPEWATARRGRTEINIGFQVGTQVIASAVQGSMETAKYACGVHLGPLAGSQLQLLRLALLASRAGLQALEDPPFASRVPLESFRGTRDQSRVTPVLQACIVARPVRPHALSVKVAGNFSREK